MDIAALIFWVLTALGGFLMLGIWVSRGGARGGESRLPVPVIFGHFGLAAIGLVVWIVYVFAGGATTAWIAFALLVPVAVLGFVMLLRWLPVRRAQGETGSATPAEAHFPLPVVAGHGLFAVVTVVLVLLGAIGAGA
ncbi:MAG: hypothetical protein GEV11_04210 [Streptosporangiales bacterium]|nr:hypothetical protein [Streptosporangiales bacterium]